ncbi:MAG TPA: MFS transporter [Gemmataceae bacterium]|jgi:nucleoside transporter|nr:MFS transporter [Gemmataceae bacterium]
MESGPLRARLAVMMFLQYSVIGSWAVPLATYLLAPPEQGGLGFTPAQTSGIYSATAFVGLGAPLLLGLLADRLFAAQRLLAVLHIVGACILFAVARFCANQQLRIRVAEDPAAAADETFAILLPLMVANAVVLILTLALSNVTGFRNLKEPKKSFGGIRLYGTLSWIVMNVLIDFFGDALSPQPLYVAAAMSLVMGLYALTLPHTPPARLGKGIAVALGVPALKMFRDPGFRVLILSALCMAAIQQFYSVYCNPFLKDIGAAKPVAVQTLAQVTEVVCMIAFPFILVRFGVKAVLAVGVFGWVVRNAVFATASLPAIAAFGLPLHGMCYTFFFVVANVYVDRHAPPHLRASAQGIYTFTSMGLGTLLGNFVSAEVMEAHRTPAGVDWFWFWMVPAVAAGVVFLAFVALFKDDPAVSAAPESASRAP